MEKNTINNQRRNKVSYTESKTVLEPGWGYFQIQRVEDKKQDGSPLLSKNGNPMIKLSLMVVDTEGTSTRLYDWVTADTDWKISNLEDVFKISNLYQEGRFNKGLLAGKSGLCSMKTQNHPTYGESTSISMYVPLDFLKIKEEEFDKKLPNEPGVNSFKKPNEPVNTKESLNKPSFDDDDIPF